MLAGLKDSSGTVDIDILRIEARLRQALIRRSSLASKRNSADREQRFMGIISNLSVTGSCFFLKRPVWVSLETYGYVDVSYLDPHHVIASKLFSAFSVPQRNQDKQDTVAALDQKLVTFQKICNVADEVFDFHLMDARSDRFSDVYEYITKKLMGDYGKVELKYSPSDGIKMEGQNNGYRELLVLLVLLKSNVHD